MENHVKMTVSAENFYLSGTEPGSMEGRCLECGNRISYGSRTDRKFCCDKCKNRWPEQPAVPDQGDKCA